MFSVMNNLLGTGIDAMYIDNDFDEVEIRSHRETEKSLEQKISVD